jgi:hypothetical protein
VQTVEESSHRKEAVGEDGLGERRFIVSWIKQQLSQRPEQAEKEAFLSKHKYVLDYHGIKKEEVLD